jgi:hypothetical protein
MEKEVLTITVEELKPGYLLFNHGTKTVAKGIQYFQKLKFPFQFVIYLAVKFFLYLLNHVGIIDKDYNGDIIVREQDNPGKFHSNRLIEEYLNSKSDVWIGIPKITDGALERGMRTLRVEAEILEGEDVFINYSFKSFFGFMGNAIGYKLTGKESWVSGKPKGTTCSQITAKLYQRHFGLFLTDSWWTWFPCEIAMDENIELRKLTY